MNWKLSALDNQKLKHFISYTKADIIVKKQKLKGANSFNISIKCLGKSFPVAGTYLDITEDKTERYYLETFLKENENKTMDDNFSYYAGNELPQYFNRDILNSIKSKLKLWPND